MIQAKRATQRFHWCWPNFSIIAKQTSLLRLSSTFFSPGHCFSSCDRSFDLLMSSIKPDKMFVPIDVIGAIKDAKKSEPKFVATPMPSRSFYSSKPLENLLVSTQKTVDGNRIKWSSYQKLIFKRHQPFSMDVTEYGAISNRTISFQAKNPVSTFSTTGLTYLNTACNFSTQIWRLAITFEICASRTEWILSFVKAW